MDRIVGIELSHRTAPIAIREQLAFNHEQTREALQKLKAHYKEVFIVSTCNRLSLYAYGDNYLALEEYLERFGDYSQYLSVLPDTRIAIANLFSTASGLESQAIGEHQIVGQIRDSLSMARKEKATGPILDELVRQAIHTGKRARLETNIGKHSASLATVGFELIKRHDYNLKDCSFLVVGTGNMANLVNTVLDRSAIKELYIASHNLERANEMAEEWGGEAVHVSKLHHVLGKADIIVGGTQGEVNLLSEKEVENSKCTRAQFAMNAKKPKLLIDFGLPRNFNPVLKEFENVHLYDLDDIKQMTFEGLKKRYDEIPMVKQIIEEETSKFTEWFYHRRASPVIEAYWKGLLEIKEDELKWIKPKLGELREDQERLIEKFAHRLIRRVSKKPLEEVNKFAQNMHHRDNPINTVKKVFDLDDVDIFVPKKRIVIGTRGSKLALTQTHFMIEKLREKEPQNEYITKIIRTSGDDGNIDVMGAFTTAIQRALLDGKVDIAVHSYKDLPIEQVPGLRLAAISSREDVRDVLITKKGEKFSELKQGAIVGTGSLRREIQLKQLRPDLEVKFIQGNLDGRMKKMYSGDYDAIVLAAAGLKRLGMLDKATDIFTEEEMIPAVCQGALALEVRDGDKETTALVQKVSHENTKIATDAERTFLLALGGGCNYPIAAYAKVDDQELNLHGMYASADGKVVAQDSIQGHKRLAHQLAQKLAEDLNQKVRQESRELQSEEKSEG
ncbi:MAG: hydroxymethylbilane synthase [Vicingaceae bacterium]